MHTVPSKPRKRWRFAFTAIYSYRVLLSLAKEIIENKNGQHTSGISRSPSCTNLHIKPKSSGNDFHDTAVFSNVDQTSLTGIVKKDEDYLRQVSGVEGVAHALHTDAENGIHTQYRHGVSLLSIHTILSKPRKRWRVALAAIYSYRVLLSLAKEIVLNRNGQFPSGISRSPSYTILHIKPNNSDDVQDIAVFSNVDQKSLAEIVKKDKDHLHQDGVESVACALDTDAENGIQGNDETILDINQNSSDNDAEIGVHGKYGTILHIKQNSSNNDAENGIHVKDGIILHTKQNSSKNDAENGIHVNDDTILHIKQNSSDSEVHDTAVISNIDQRSLTEIVKKKDMDHLRQVGGVEGLAHTLNTDAENGIHGNDEGVSQRRKTYGSNTFHMPPPKSFFPFVLESFNDITIIILLACAALSLGFGMGEEGLKEGWYEGGSIFVAVFLVVSVSAVTNFRQSRQFEKLSKVSNNIQVDVIRDGRRQQVSIFDIVVGDIVCLKIGDQIPADGLFLDGFSLQVDESSMTGESNPVEVDCSSYPFLFSGTKVADGYARMLVTSVGMNTAWGEMMSLINRDTKERTPLQARLDKLTSSIGKVGLTVSFLVLVVLLVRYFTGNTVDENGQREFNRGKTKIGEVLNAMVHIVAAAVTIVVVAIPEGLPLAVMLTLAYSMKRMMTDQAMVRKLSACETMGSATTICTDKTGTLTLNQMKVTKFWLGQEEMTGNASTDIIPNVLQLLHQGVALNTTGSVYRPTSNSKPEFSGSPTEKAILSWAVLKLGMDIEEVKRSCTILQVEAFNSEKKRSGVLIRKKVDNDNTIHVHWKGAAEIILAMCSNYYDCSGIMKAMDEGQRMKNEQIIQDMAVNSLRCIAFAHKQIPDEELECNDNGKTHKRLKEDGLILLGVVGLKDPCRPEVRTAVKACKDAGVNIKMITGDNVFTAKAIAIECGILNPNQDRNSGEVVEGLEFRNYTEEERMEKVDKIQVMARSSPFDKLLMVQCLKQKGHVVAVTGDGTNDAPALKEADVGLSMGIQGTEVAKESSDIVILDDNFASVATVLSWGRCVYNNIQKFIQFQLTVNVAALTINFVAAVSAGEVPLTAVQLLWVNLIMDTLAALALATERPTEELMKKPPIGRTEPLVTNVMWRNLMSQALYQITIVLVLQFKGTSIFNVNEKVKNTLIFNTFVLCQVFNEFNARKLEKKNVFKEIHKNHLFLGIVGITIVLQVVMVEFLKRFANTERLNCQQWVVCIGIAAVSWPIGWFFKFIPISDK